MTDDDCVNVSRSIDQLLIWNCSLNLTSQAVTVYDTSGDVLSPVYAYPLVQLVCISAIIGLLILFTIIGNVFVISAILLEKTLRTEQNYLILSLAMTDLMVAVLVMPLSLVNEVSSQWYLGDRLCDMWVSFDVLCCTSSILHLVAIACDRYMAVTRIDYIRQRNWRRIGLMVVVVWVISAGVSIPPLFGWKDDTKNPEITGMCLISQDLAYTVFSTGAAFYFPMLLMVILNYKIYTTAKWRIKKRRTLKGSFHRSDNKTDFNNRDSKRGNGTAGAQNVSDENKTVFEIDDNASQKVTHIPMHNISPIALLLKNHYIKCSLSPAIPAVCPHQYSPSPQRQHDGVASALARQRRQEEQATLKRQRSELRREKKAARVLGIITGAFIACWLPFFILALLGPFCGSHCDIPTTLVSFFLWLGYFNSFLNPVIYTVFNHHFRTAFNKMFSGDICRRKHCQ